MNFSINLGGWNSIFAVPADVVDKYIKIASGTSIKVLLYCLRNSGGRLSLKSVSEELCISEEDVSDSMMFWRQVGLFSFSENIYTPAVAVEEKNVPSSVVMTAPTASSSDEDAVRLAVSRAAALRTPEFSPVEIADTIKSDDKINYLFKTCENLYGRPLKHTEQNALITITEHIGLPAEVALMLVDYCFSIEKTSPAYLRSVAMNWVENDVVTLPAAEQYVTQLQAAYGAESMIRSMFGLNRALSKKEKEYANVWVNDWGFSSEVISAAYEINVNAKGNCSFPYINKILESWKDKGITSKEQIDQQASDRKTMEKAPSSLDIQAINDSVLEEYM